MLSFTVKGGDSVARTQKLFLDAIKAAAEATVEHWHEKYLPGHFTVEGFDRYGYQLRKGQDEPAQIYSDNQKMRTAGAGRHGRLISNPAYYWRKWRMKKTHAPLVFTGDSRRQAEQSIRITSKAVEGHVTAKGAMDLPRYFYMFDKSKGAPDKAGELTRTTADEDLELSDFYAQTLGRHLASASAPESSQRIA